MFKKITHALKNEFAAIILTAIFGTVIIIAGSMIATIGSREIAKPFTVNITDQKGRPIPTITAYMQLARAGVIINMTHDQQDARQWLYQDVYITNIFIGGESEDVGRITNVNVTFGDKSFKFNKSEFQHLWGRVEPYKVEHLISQSNNSHYELLKAPEDVRYSTSNIPVKKEFFSSIINWGGDSDVFIKPIKTSIPNIFIFLASLVMTLLVVAKSRRVEKKSIQRSSNDAKESFAFIFTLTTSVILLTVVNVFIYSLYKPDTSRLFNEIPHIYIKSQIVAFAPEPIEQLAVMASILLSPLLILLSISLYNIFSRQISATRMTHTGRTLSNIAPSILFTLIYLGLGMSNFLYLNESILGDHILRYLYLIILFPAGLLLTLRPELLHKVWKKRVITLAKLLVLFVFIILFGSSIQTSIDSATGFHSNPVIYPISQVAAGKIMLVDVASLYGLFPMFIAPIVSALGFNIIILTSIFGAIICISYFCIFQFIKSATASKVFAYLGFFSVVLYSYFTELFMPGGLPYYQYWPTRILFPSLFLVLIARYMSNRSARVYATLIATASLGLLWNLDSGIVVVGALVAAVVYDEFSRENWRAATLRILRHLFIIAITIVSTFALFEIYAYIGSGKWPNLGLLTLYQKMFLSGYFLIPMPPPPHTWFTICLAYMAGLLLSLRAQIEKRVNVQHKILFVLSVLGLGLFVYYTGRSHDYSLFGPSFPALLIAAIFADILYKKIKDEGARPLGHSLVFALLCCILFAAPVSILLNARIYLSKIQSTVEASRGTPSVQYKDNLSFIKSHSKAGQDVLIFAKNTEGLYYGESKTRSAIDTPSSTDRFFLSEIDSIVRFIQENKHVPVFVQDTPAELASIDPKINSILAGKYFVSTTSTNGMTLFQPKP